MILNLTSINYNPFYWELNKYIQLPASHLTLLYHGHHKFNIYTEELICSKVLPPSKQYYSSHFSWLVNGVFTHTCTNQKYEDFLNILFSFFSHMQPSTLCKILSVFTPTNVLNISISFHVHCYHHHANHHPLLSRIQPPIGLFILSFVLPHKFVTIVTVIFYYYTYFISSLYKNLLIGL